MEFVKYVYSASGHMVDATDLCMAYTHTFPMYVPKIYGIYAKCGCYICFWLNTMHHYINGLEKRET